MSVTAMLFALPAGESFPVRFAPLSTAACCQNICQLCWFDFPTGRLFETTLLTKCLILFLTTNRNKQTNFSPWDLVNFIHVKFFVSRVGEEGLLRLWQDSLKFLTRPSQNPLNQVLVNFDWMTSKQVETQDLTPDSKLSPRKTDGVSAFSRSRKQIRLVVFGVCFKN